MHMPTEIKKHTSPKMIHVGGGVYEDVVGNETPLHIRKYIRHILAKTKKGEIFQGIHLPAGPTYFTLTPAEISRINSQYLPSLIENQ